MPVDEGLVCGICLGLKHLESTKVVAYKSDALAIVTRAWIQCIINVIRIRPHAGRHDISHTISGTNFSWVSSQMWRSGIQNQVIDAALTDNTSLFLSTYL